jgi:hypothetical protein
MYHAQVVCLHTVVDVEGVNRYLHVFDEFGHETDRLQLFCDYMAPYTTFPQGLPYFAPEVSVLMTEIG